MNQTAELNKSSWYPQRAEMADEEIDYNIVFPDAGTLGEHHFFIVLYLHASLSLAHRLTLAPWGEVKTFSSGPFGSECQFISAFLALTALVTCCSVVWCVFRETLAWDKGASCDSAGLGWLQRQTPLQIQLHLQRAGEETEEFELSLKQEELGEICNGFLKSAHYKTGRKKQLNAFKKEK